MRPGGRDQPSLGRSIGRGAATRERYRALPHPHTDATFGRNTLTSSSPPAPIPDASWLKLVSSSAFWLPANARTPSTTPTPEPLPPKIDTPPTSTIATTSSSSPTPLLATEVESLKV